MEDMKYKARDSYDGLNDEEVRCRINKGQVNKFVKSPSRTIAQIIRANIFTLFNGINIVLALVVILAGSAKNSIFAVVIVSNTIIGVIQEVRAKRTIEKLSLLSKSKVSTIRNGEKIEIDADDIVIDDLLCFSEGQQIPVDCKVVSEEGIQVNEALLTGESDLITKKKGEELLSGSFIGSGAGYAVAIRVGKDTYSAKLSEEARKFKKIKSVLQESIDTILKVILKVIVPTAALLTLTQALFSERPWQDIIIGVVAGISGMIPEGLVLLTSVTFVVSIVRLSKYNTLVQELPATEVLARVNVLCLDKTGTITNGSMKLNNIKYYNDDKEYVDKNLAGMIYAFMPTNETHKAMINRFPNKPNIEVSFKVPFSSERKWSSAVLDNNERWYLGAPEIIYKDKYSEIEDDVFKEVSQGRRVLMLAKTKEVRSDYIPSDIEVQALIIFEEHVREDAKETLDFFEKQGVTIKIISGDNPISVSAVAKNAGVINYDKYIDMSTFEGTSYKYEEIVEDYTVFGRVTPHQKKKLVKALKKSGNTVAMTGDGINDVLALKESDCAIAMASGSDVAKAVSQLVLIDSNFASLPHIVDEGRKAINNLELAANLYLTKTTYAVLISILMCIVFLPFPYEPIQLTIIGTLGIGIPSFFVALQPNKEVLKDGFLRRILVRSVPNGIAIALGVVLISILMNFLGYDIKEVRTTCILFMGIMSMIVLASVLFPFTKLKLIVLTVAIILFILSFSTNITRMIFSFSVLSISNVIICIVAVVLATILIKVSRSYVIKYADKKNII